MFRFLSRHRARLIIGILLVYPLVSYLITGHRGRKPNVFDRAILALSSPVQEALTRLFSSTVDLVQGYVALRGAHKQAAQCGMELEKTQAALNTLRETASENARLKALLDYVELSGGQEVVARIIGLNPTAQFQSVRINRGENDGVHRGMPVVTHRGVVGHVVRAVGNSADVMLLTDRKARIGSVLQRTRVRATVTGLGNGRQLSLRFVPRGADAQDGDLVVTSGTDGIFPPGLYVGTVQGVSRSMTSMFLSAQVEPAVDLKRTEEVLVIPMALTLPASTATKGVLQ